MGSKINSLIKNMSLFVLSMLIFILIFEVILRITYPLYADYNTEMWRYAVELKQKSNISGLKHEHKPSKSGYFYGVELQTNSLGIRSYREYDIPKPANVIRILVLGDSITLGWGVSYNDTYPKVLESLLNNGSRKIEVINTGVGNYNTVSELLALKKFMDLDPDMIILGFYINDLEKLDTPSKIGYVIKSNSYTYAFLYDKVVNTYYNVFNDYKNFYSELYKEGPLKDTANSALIEMIEIANNKSIPFVLVNIPELHNLESNEFPEVQEFLQDIVKEHPEVVYIDLFDSFKGEEPTTLWVSLEDSHPNAKGHKIIAQEIYKVVANLLKNESIAH